MSKAALVAMQALESELAQTAAVMRGAGAARPRGATAMRRNVTERYVSRANRLPKPPPPTLPDDPNADAIVASIDDVPTLSPAQRIAIGALVLGETVMSAARRAGVSRQTVFRWRREPAFVRTLDRLSADTLEASLRRMRSLLLRSTHVLADALHGSDQHKWAMRMIGSRQVWAMTARTPAPADDAADDDEVTATPAAGPVEAIARDGAARVEPASDGDDRCGAD